ncbi:MAG: arginine--tRNA ligase [Deltaproteobacteria bacterium]|nr:arginine--tRNA ligase [Deltaproteobacteria bacterium]
MQKIKEKIESLIERALEQINIPAPEIVFSVPKQTVHGDLSTNIAMILAKEAKKPPRVLAEDLLRQMMPLPDWIEKAEIAGPGFINFFLKPHAYFNSLAMIMKEGKKFGSTKKGKGEKIILEFVSANPTGPLNVVSARAAAVGDTLANLLKAAGFKAHKEFYVNDVGNQIELFAESLRARYLQALGKEAAIPEEGYQGEYLKRLGEKLARSSFRRTPESSHFKKVGLKKMLDGQKKSLKRFGVVFDKWYLQSDLIKKKKLQKSLARLKKRGFLYEKEGAVFFRSTAFGDDKDRVVQKQDGEYSYFASDIAYHEDKFKRGVRVIDLFGPDHHGYVARTRASVAALGFDPEKLTILIIQQVNLLENEVVVKMSKRAGKLITMDDLLDEISPDVARFFFLQRASSTPLDFDLALAKKETPENPVYYIQYAHARIASIFRKAKTVIPAKAGIQSLLDPDFRRDDEKVDLSLLTLPQEKELAKKLLQFPEVIAEAAKDLAAHHLPFYALELAKEFQAYYSHAKQDARYKVVDAENRPKTLAKLYLLKNIQIVLQNALKLMGISAPERMESKDVASPI